MLGPKRRSTSQPQPWEVRGERRPWPSREEWAWIAGLYEGEGSITKKHHGAGIQITLASTDRDTLDRLHHLTGMGGVYPQRWAGAPANWSPRWQWSIGYSSEVHAFAVAILPWLLSRRRQQVLTVVGEYLTRKRERRPA